MTAVHSRPFTLGVLSATLVLAFSAPPVLAAPAAAPPPAAASGDDDEAPAFDATGLAIRHHQLKLHQALGLTTLGVMAATTGLGLASTNGLLRGLDPRELHLAAAGLTTGLYLATATLALTTPPPLEGPTRPWDTVNIHRNLGWLHAAGMAGTVGLGLANVLGPTDVTSTHGLAGYATLGLMAASAAVVAFGE